MVRLNGNQPLDFVGISIFSAHATLSAFATALG